MKRVFMVSGYGITLFKRSEGQSMVEFALILPFFVLFLVGIFDLGRAFFSFITITNAAREGARYATLHPRFYNPSGVDPCLWQPYSCIVKTAKDEAVGSFIDLYSTDASISVNCSDTDVNSTCDSDQSVNVTVSYIYHDMILSFFSPSGIRMQRSVEMLVP